VKISDEALVLVAYLPTPKDLEIVRMLGWYRIPLRTSPKLIEVDYFAFFQGANFGEDHHWKIEYVAEYQGHELTTRAEILRDEPNHPRAKEEYFKVQLGPMIQLDHPIVAGKWKRLTFLFTTGELLNTAESLNDLVLEDSEREVLWKCLRERAQSSDWYRANNERGKASMQELLRWLSLLNTESKDQDFTNY
jgi:hypothetical protein